MTDAQVFSHTWFSRSQQRLLTLCNHPATRWATRQVLGITLPGPVRELTPWRAVTRTDRLGDADRLTALVLTRPLYAHRLRERLRAVWEIAHWFDTHIANPVLPALNLGFDSYTAYPEWPVALDAVLIKTATASSGPAAWAAAHDAPTADSVSEDFLWGCTEVATEYDFGSTYTARVVRGGFSFDLTGLSGTVSAATLGIYGDMTYNWPSPDDRLAPYAFSPANPASFATGDFDAFGSTAYADAIPDYDWNTYYNPFAFNATGLAVVTLGAMVTVGMRSVYYDVDNTPPLDMGYISGWGCDFWGWNGHPPYLEVTYTASGTTPPHRATAILL